MSDNKNNMKNEHRNNQGGKCYLSDKQLSRVNKLTDLSKFLKKENGGYTTKQNTSLVDPVEHMKANGNYREREGKIAALKSLIDARENYNKMKVGMSNRLDAMMRGCDMLDEDTAGTIYWTENVIKVKLEEIEKRITKLMKELEPQEPVLQASKDVKGVGMITLAYCLIYVNPEIADTVSKVWSYAGLHKPSHKRYEKSERGKHECGCKPLRTSLYTMAESTIKTRGAYREVYDRTKTRLQQSEKVTETRVPGKSKPVEKKWKDCSPGHRDGAAKRAMMKHFLSDYLYVARKVRGLEMRGLYAQDQLGHTGIIHPSERGWDID